MYGISRNNTYGFQNAKNASRNYIGVKMDHLAKEVYQDYLEDCKYFREDPMPLSTFVTKMMKGELITIEGFGDIIQYAPWSF